MNIQCGTTALVRERLIAAALGPTEMKKKNSSSNKFRKQEEKTFVDKKWFRDRATKEKKG